MGMADTKPCRHCKEPVKPDATRCPHCSGKYPHKKSFDEKMAPFWDHPILYMSFIVLTTFAASIATNIYVGSVVGGVVLFVLFLIISE